MTKKYSVIPHGTVAILSLWLIGCQTINFKDLTEAITPEELTQAVTPPKVTQAVAPPKVTQAVTASNRKDADTQKEEYQNLKFIVWSKDRFNRVLKNSSTTTSKNCTAAHNYVSCVLPKNFSSANFQSNQDVLCLPMDYCEQIGGNPGVWYSYDYKTKKALGFSLFQNVVIRELKLGNDKIIGEKPKAPSKIKQGKYESLSQFEARANSLKTKYRQDIQEYTLKVNNFPQWQKNRIIEKSFFSVFDIPKVAKTHYDPESQIFGVEVTASGSRSGSTRFHLMINDVISNADAAAFDLALKDAEPVLRFKLSEGKISLSDAIINIEGRPYAAISVDRNFNKVELAEVDLSTVKQVTTAPETFAIEYSENPTIKSRQIELEQLKIERNTEAKLAQLEAEIVRLKSKTSQAFDDDLLGIVDKLSAIKLDSQKYLFAVGISAYDDVPDVPFADRSAKMVVSVLQKRFGVPAENTYALIDEQATGTKIKGRLAVMLNRVKANDTVYFYYAGHGVPSRDGNQAYLLPRDGGIGSYQDPDFAFSKLLSQLGNSAASRAVVFIDACFSGKANADELVFEGVAPIILSQKEEQFDRNKITIFMAGKGDQFANQYLEKGHRLFSYHLISAIAKRNLNIAMLGEHISKQVSDHSRKLGVTYTQEPFTDGYNKGMLGDRY
jgi:hypothetical protein